MTAFEMTVNEANVEAQIEVHAGWTHDAKGATFKSENLQDALDNIATIIHSALRTGGAYTGDITIKVIEPPRFRDRKVNESLSDYIAFLSSIPEATK